MSDIDEDNINAISDLPLWSDDEAKAQLEIICKKFNVPIDVIIELVVLQRERQHQEKARGIALRFEEILGRMD